MGKGWQRILVGHATSTAKEWHFALMPVYMSFGSLEFVSGTILSLSDALIQFILWYSAEAFFQPMNTQCISCCSFLHLSYSCLRVKITPLTVVDVLFVITNCSSHIFTMFLSRFSCTLTLYRFMPWLVRYLFPLLFLLGYFNFYGQCLMNL